MKLKYLLIIAGVLAIMAVPLLLLVGSREQANPFPENQAVEVWQSRLCGGTAESPDQALDAAWQAALADDADAAYALGYIYLTGVCLPRDEEQAVTLLNRAAGLGSAEAQRLLDQREADQVRFFPPVDSFSF